MARCIGAEHFSEVTEDELIQINDLLSQLRQRMRRRVPAGANTTSARDRFLMDAQYAKFALAASRACLIRADDEITWVYPDGLHCRIYPVVSSPQ